MIKKQKHNNLVDFIDGKEIENVSYIIRNLKSEKKEKDEQQDKSLDESYSIDNLLELAEEKEEGELSVDIYEDEKNLYLLSPIAGVDINHIEINYNQGILTIKGKRKLDNKIDGKNILIQECYWGNFSRSILLPEDVDSSKIKASFKNSVLKIVLPKLDLPVNVDIKLNK